MERKTKQRIIGILVVIGLVVILLPLFQGGKEASVETALVKAPPFPDQSIQATSGSLASASDEAAIPVVNPTTASNEGVNQRPDDTININQPIIASNAPTVTGASAMQSNGSTEPTKEVAKVATTTQTENAPTTTSVATPEATKSIAADDKPTTVMPVEKAITTAEADKTQVLDEPATLDEDEETAALKKAQKISAVMHPEQTVKKAPVTASVKKSSYTTKHLYATPKVQLTHAKVTTPLHAPLDANGLINLHNAAWVIQLGSFKNKSNALRLVNQLRSHGYSAFIQQVSTTFGNHTRVFVGPESQQASARALANQLEDDMHIRGIVISYKPLNL